MSWPEVPIGEIFEVARGGSPRPIDQFITDDPDGLNWVMIGDATASDKYINETKKKIRPEGLKKTREVEPGDFILSNSMSFGKPYIMGIKGCIHDGWLLLRPQSDQIHPDYFYHLLGSEPIYQKFASRAAGATVKNLNSGIVRDVEIPLPPLEEQKRIAGILDQAAELCRLRTRALDKLNTLGQAIFHEMFGDVGNNSLSLPTSTVGELCHRVSVGVVIKPASYYKDNGIPAIRGTNIKETGIDLTDLVFFSPEANDGPLRKSKVSAGDVLAVRSGRPGLAAIVPSELDGANCIDVLIACPDRTKLLSVYLRDFLNSSDGRQLVLSGSVGQVQKHFNVKSLSEAEIPLPTLDCQQRYADRVAACEPQRQELTAALCAQQALFASLQHRAFRGEL
ncbi:restriction endonuclease subunit S [Rhodospirillum sp. A1_3_36]|uniref:restriction endonuclease subunit S n=1 Tax=Rhodospirillum sp. A1_3_36 TaxID=3391666 RepID=UPI0039A4976E